MKINTELLNNLNIELGYELDAFANSGHDEISDYCHEYADSCQDVIYYGKAEALYNQASNEERDEAESLVEDCGGFGEGANMAKRFTLLAYWIAYNRLMEAIREQAEEAEEKIDSVIADLEGLRDTFSDLN